MKPFSVLMSIYKNEKPEYFEEAMNSILCQTSVPDEIVLIRDGAVPECLQEVIDSFLKTCPVRIKYIPFEKNGGLGNALRVGVESSTNELIARMDTDDISVSSRFELQLNAFEKDPTLDLVGGQVLEFENDVSDVSGKRSVPAEHGEIAAFLKKRNAFNHPTVMFKKSSVLKAGNYRGRHLVEDYDLWLRMLADGCRFLNLPDTLVCMRVSPGMYDRRGGIEYFRSLKDLEKDKRIAKIVSPFRYSVNIFIRFVQCVAFNNRLRRIVYQKVLRKKR